MVTTLDKLSRGRRGTVLSVSGTRSFRLRIQEMGVVPGRRVEVLDVAPFGDPIKLRVPHYLLAIRRGEAELVTVKVVE